MSTAPPTRRPGGAPHLLESVDEIERSAIRSCLRRRTYSKGQTVFSDGDRGDALFIAETGRLEVLTSTLDGQQFTLRVIHPGEMFGEMALVHPDSRRTGQVRALEESALLALSRSDFDAIRRVHPGVDRFLVAALAERLVRTTELAVQMLLPAETRVWKRLSVLADAYGDAPIRMSQEVLARASGTVRQTANRVLQIGQRDGILLLERGSIRVLDHAAIEARSR